jgi:hypothetical protein
MHQLRKIKLIASGRYHTISAFRVSWGLGSDHIWKENNNNNNEIRIGVRLTILAGRIVKKWRRKKLSF